MSVKSIILKHTVTALTITAIIFGGWFFVGCGGKPVGKQDYGDTYTDKRDGKVYKLVTIGTQIWFASNLDYAADGSKCYGEDGSIEKCDADTCIHVTLSNAEIQANCQAYGMLYNWEMAKKVCPTGFHLPSVEEWDVLVNYAGGDTAGERLKAKTGWNCLPTYVYKIFPTLPKDVSIGTDEYGFSALPGGSNDKSNGGFGNIGHAGYWWSGTETKVKSNDAWYRSMSYGFKDVGKYANDKSHLCSVRCVAD